MEKQFPIDFKGRAGGKKYGELKLQQAFTAQVVYLGYNGF